LEAHVADPDFEPRWRAFVRDCSLLLLPFLPPETAEWFVAADEFDAGRLSSKGLTKVRARAWRFYDSLRETNSEAELEPLRAAMYPLWPGIEDDWYGGALLFVQALYAAGVTGEQWWPLLQPRFADVFDPPTDA
jgi:hypothetical protein